MSKQATKALIDANITANGTQAITGPILNNVLNTMVDDYGTQEELSQLSQEVTDNAENIVNLQQEIDSIQPIIIEGNVTNAPDEEDLTTNDNDLLKFADRSTAVNQMGYVILRKNKTLAEQVTQSNTIYEIRCDFALTANFTMPSGCILRFNGGRISGSYTVTGERTRIEAPLSQIFDENLSVTGTWDVSEVFPEWFGAKCDGVHDDGISINKLFGFNNSFAPIKVSFTQKEYTVGVSIDFNYCANIQFVGTEKNVIKKFVGDYRDMFLGSRAKNIMFQNLVFDGSFTDFSIVIDAAAWAEKQFCACARIASESTELTMNDCVVRNFNYGVLLGGAYESHLPRTVDNDYTTEHITITNNRFEHIKQAAIDTYNQFGLFISNNYITNCGFSVPAICIEPSESRVNSNPLDIDTDNSFALSDAVTICDNKIINTSDFTGAGAIKLFSGIVKAIVENNYIVNSGRMAIEVNSPILLSIHGNIIQECNGVNIWGLPGIVSVSNNKILDSPAYTVKVSRSSVSDFEQLRMCNNFLKLSDDTDSSSDSPEVAYNNSWIYNNCFVNAKENNPTYRRRAALYIDSVNSGMRIFNNILLKSKETAVPYFIRVPVDTDFVSLNAEVYNNISFQSLTNAQVQSVPLTKGTTAQRPTKNNIKGAGYTYFDTTIGKPIFLSAIASDGTFTWVDATGASV